MASSPPDHPPRGFARSLLFLLAGAGIGLALGLRLSPPDGVADAPTSSAATPLPATTLPESASSPPLSEATHRTTESEAPLEVEAPPVPEQIPAPSEPSDALQANVRLVQHELRELSRALSDPGAYQTVTAVLHDLEAYESARRRREALLATPAAAVLREPLPPLPSGLRENATLLAAEGRWLVLPVTGVPDGFAYLPAMANSAGGGGAGVVLTEREGARTVAYRYRWRGDDVSVEVTEGAHSGRDRLEMSTLREDGSRAVVRICALEQRGRVWGNLLEDLFNRGAVSHEALRSSLTQPLDRALALGWLDWLRGSLGLPPNLDLGEETGNVHALPWGNPLLLSDTSASPMVLDRPDIALTPGREEPPLPPPARGPLFLLASNGIAIHDDGWRWLVFDAEQRRVVHHMRSAAGHLRWDYTLDPAGVPAGHEDERFAALAARSKERIRQVLSLVALRRELVSLNAELERRVGGLYTRDGLEACRLREEIIRRTERVQALSHLLLDAEGVRRADRAVQETKRRTTATIVSVIEAMIEAGRSGPVEYLLRDDAVKEILFKAPQAYRLRVVRKFRRRFRPFGTRVSLSLSGHSSRWYESVQWFEEE